MVAKLIAYEFLSWPRGVCASREQLKNNTLSFHLLQHPWRPCVLQYLVLAVKVLEKCSFGFVDREPHGYNLDYN